MANFNKLRNKLNAVLFIAALYFILWSVLVLVSPTLAKSIIVETNVTSIVFWDMVSIITIVLGVGLLIASFDPYRNWLILLINFLFHLGVVIGFVVGYSRGLFNDNFLPFLFFNHFIWIVPLFIGLYSTYRRLYFADNVLIDTFSSEYYPLEIFETIKGENLAELSEQSPVLLVFLRHFGCPFCQESLQQLSEKRAEIESKGIRILLVYMADQEIAQQFLQTYNLEDIDQLSDPESIAYKRFKLHRGSFNQLLGIKVLYRWTWLAIKKKIYYKGVVGDIYQMPGIFLLHQGQIVKQFVHRSSADIPDYREFISYSY
ncbi:MAG: SelL-related redox protein [Chitinophagales bacterium]